MVADPHGWNSWQSYRAAHEGKLADYADHFLLENRLTFSISPELVYWDGELVCADGFEIHVHRWQQTGHKTGALWVQTTTYSYHVLQRFERGVIDVFRVDNIHVHEGHADSHHRHDFDAFGKERISHLGRDGWMNLGQVLDETYERWQRQTGGS